MKIFLLLVGMVLVLPASALAEDVRLDAGLVEDYFGLPALGGNDEENAASAESGSSETESELESESDSD